VSLLVLVNEITVELEASEKFIEDSKFDLLPAVFVALHVVKHNLMSFLKVED
jgi:hypothetical protein